MESKALVKQLVADIVFYATLNFIGFYVRYVGEINMRRGFLDKRSCIDATFKLKYEKEQEVRKKVELSGSILIIKSQDYGNSRHRLMTLQHGKQYFNTII